MTEDTLPTIPSVESTDPLDSLTAEATPTTEAPIPEAPPVPEDKPKKVFTKKDIRRTIDVEINMPRLYEGYDPWGFKLRLKLSTEAEERRQEYLSLSASEQTVALSGRNLDEVCDLLTELPTGFGDLIADGKGPGSSFRTYVETCEDPTMKDLLLQIVEGVDNVYWATISPREFRK